MVYIIKPITFVSMKTNPQLKNVSDVISVLMMSDVQFDMETIQLCAEAEMDRCNVGYKAYMEVLEANDEKYEQTPFDTTDEYLFDTINNMAITPEKIYRMVELCMEVR